MRSKVFYNFILIFSDESIAKKANIFYLSQLDQWFDKSKLPHSKCLNRPLGVKTFLIFVYGVDFTRQNIFRHFFILLAGTWIYIALIVWAMTILFFLRRGELHRVDVFTSAYMDITIALTGAANLRYGNHLEKIFFMILLFGAFFINTIALDNFLFYIFLTDEPERVDSFVKFAEIDPPTVLNSYPVEKFRYKFEIFMIPEIVFISFNIFIIFQKKRWYLQ